MNKTMSTEENINIIKTTRSMNVRLRLWAHVISAYLASQQIRIYIHNAKQKEDITPRYQGQATITNGTINCVQLFESFHEGRKMFSPMCWIVETKHYFVWHQQLQVEAYIAARTTDRYTNDELRNDTIACFSCLLPSLTSICFIPLACFLGLISKASAHHQPLI